MSKKIDVRLTVPEIQHIMLALKTIEFGAESPLYDRLSAVYAMNYEIPSLSLSEWNEKHGEENEEE